jgi:ABC-type transport system involved in multi-copper enzyme maturation permease subunit
VSATFAHTLVMTVRRKRAILAGGIALTPVLAPLAMAFLSAAQFGAEGNEIFVEIVDYVYLRTMAPLMALFFGCMLIGEDVEGETIPYFLTRPLPRSAWILGKYFAFMVVAAGLLLPSILLTFFACTTLAEFSVTATNVKLLLHYEGVMVMALLGYGAVCLFLGALVRRPIIVGVVALFAWQRLAVAIPGVIDFITIEKYVVAMLPKLATEGENVVLQTALMEFKRKVFFVGAVKAGATLLVISFALLALTTFVVRWREYSSARALGG